MPETLASAVVPADAETTWQVVRDFNGLPGWHPAIAGCHLEDGPPDRIGAIRNLTLADDGGAVREILVEIDDRERSLTYAILDSPFPVDDYRSTIRVVPVTSTGESFVSWSVRFDCDRADSERLSAMFSEDVFGTGLRGLFSYFSPDV